jgi:tetratricopeptide (TPR) repeat protein
MGLNEAERVKEQRRKRRFQIAKYVLTLAVTASGILGAGMLVARFSATTKEDFVASGDAYMQRNQYAEAIIEYLNAANLDSSDGETRSALAKAYLHEGQLAKAIDESVRAADLQPGRIDAQFEAIRLLLLARRFADARFRAESILEQDPKHVEAQIAKATAVAEIDLADSLFEIEPATRLGSANERGYVLLGTLQDAQPNFFEAEAEFKRAVELAPSSADALQVLAAFYWKTGRLAAAETTLRHAVDVNPAHLSSRRRLAAFLVSVGRAAEAEAPLRAIADSARNSQARLALADYYVSQGRTAEARTILERLAKAADGVVASKIRLARIHFGEGPASAAQAHRMLSEALTRDPGNLDALLLRAQILMAERNVARAVAIAEEAVAARPGSADARTVLAEAYSSRGDLTAAIDALNEAARLNPALVSAKLRLSQLHLQRREVSTAVRLADDAVRTAPGSVTARLVRARANMAQGALSAAAVDLALLTENVPTLAVVHAQLGKLELQRSNFAASRRAFERALQLDSSSLDALRGVVELDVIEKRPERALALLEQRLRVSPNDASLLMLTASLHQTRGDLARRESALLQVVQIDPGNQEAFVALAKLYMDQQKLDQALARFQELTHGPAAAGAQTMLGLILEAQNKPAEARVAYEKALAIADESAVAANNLAWLYAQSGDSLDSALQFAQTATRLQPDSPAFHDTLGWVYLKKGLPESALQSFKFSVDAAPADPQYRYHLGLAYAEAGENEKAARELAEALKRRPGYRSAELALEALEARETSGPQ